MTYLLEGMQSNRLLFRRVTSSDYDAWLPFHKEPLSSQYWSGLPQHPETACKKQLDTIFERYIEGTGGMNALICNKTNRFIGMCGLLLQEVDGVKEMEIAYSIVPEFWRKGYATEAAERCKEVAFTNQWASHLISIIHIDNIPSQNVALKNGMELYKTTQYKKNPVHIYRVNS